MNALIDSTQELLRFAIAERDAFYDCSTDPEGNLTDPGDQAELDRMDQMIDRAQAALSGTEQMEAKDAARYRHIRKCGTLSDNITDEMFDAWVDRLMDREECNGDGHPKSPEHGSETNV
jgi:hypothetical protein